MAHDHLLVIEAGAYSEQAKRIYLDDIQTITITPTPTARKVGSGLFAIGILLLLLIGLIQVYSADSDASFALRSVFTIVFASVAVLLFWASATRLIAMPSCICVVHTATQAHPVLALSSLRKSEKFVAFIRPYLDSTQGAIPTERFEQPIQPILARAAVAPKSGATSKSDAPNPPLKPLFHWMNFVLVLAGAANGATSFYYDSDVLKNIGMAGLLLNLIALVMAIIRQNTSRCPWDLKLLTWLVFANIAISFVFAATVMPFIIMSSGSAAPNFNISSTEMMAYPAYQWFLLVDVASMTAIGVLGIMRLARGVNMSAPEPPPMAASVAPPPLPPVNESLPPSGEDAP
jgi:hypothetical protein